MLLHQNLSASSGQWLRRHDLLNFIATLYEGDLHAKRVLSLANATLGVLTSASLAIHAVGRGLAQALGTLTKHGVKQVDRLLSNRGVDVWTFFAYWTPFIVGARMEVVVALDWTSFAADGQDTIVLSMVTGHGRATPLLWKTVASSTLKGNQRRFEYEVLCRLRGPQTVPAGSPRVRGDRCAFVTMSRVVSVDPRRAGARRPGPVCPFLTCGFIPGRAVEASLRRHRSQLTSLHPFPSAGPSSHVLAIGGCSDFGQPAHSRGRPWPVCSRRDLRYTCTGEGRTGTVISLPLG